LALLIVLPPTHAEETGKEVGRMTEVTSQVPGEGLVITDRTRLITRSIAHGAGSAAAGDA
jgi:hypothetical protein